jgi:hypothetical protein
MRDVDGARIEADVLAGLKRFQRATVKHVFHEMYLRMPDPATRFLVADEVGLGKTLVARGLIAKTINYLQRAGTRRIDVIYICSNAAIAAQNIRRLNVTGDKAFERPTRITLLPRQIQEFDANGVNFVSLTPGTSFNMGDRGGRSDERTVVFRLLEYVLGESLDRPGAYRALRGSQREDRFRNGVHWTPPVATRAPIAWTRGSRMPTSASSRPNRSCCGGSAGWSTSSTPTSSLTSGTSARISSATFA